MSELILMATSLIPNGRTELQRKALRSWECAGAKIVSLNSPQEIAELRSEFEDFEFVSVPDDASAFSGRPLVYIANILEYLKSSNAEFVGITNADIYIDGPTELASIYKQEAAGSLICGPRYDVSSLDSKNGNLDACGFDYFIYDRNINFPSLQNRLCLGMPFWDHWVPLTGLLSGIEIKILDSPVAHHASHPVKWSDQTLSFNDEFIRLLILLRDITPNSTLADRRLTDFRTIPIEQTYYKLKHRMQEMRDSRLDSDDSMRIMGELASFYDDTTKSIIKFIRAHAKIIHI